MNAGTEYRVLHRTKLPRARALGMIGDEHPDVRAGAEIIACAVTPFALGLRELVEIRDAEALDYDGWLDVDDFYLDGNWLHVVALGYRLARRMRVPWTGADLDGMTAAFMPIETPDTN